jgi:hypothetical protein
MLPVGPLAKEIAGVSGRTAPRSRCRARARRSGRRQALRAQPANDVVDPQRQRLMHHEQVGRVSQQQLRHIAAAMLLVVRVVGLRVDRRIDPVVITRGQQHRDRRPEVVNRRVVLNELDPEVHELAERGIEKRWSTRDLDDVRDLPRGYRLKFSQSWRVWKNSK